MVYPIEPYVDYDPTLPEGGHGFGYNLHKRVWTKAVTMGITEEQFDARFRLVNKLLEIYRKDGFRINWALFGREDAKEIPDTTLISPLFEIYSEDPIISVGVSYYDLMRAPNIYPEERKVLRELGDISELVVGGFHKDDCVSRFVDAAREKGIAAGVDDLLTEDFFHYMLHTFDHDMTAYMLQAGTMIDEDADPDLDKKILFDGRLDAYF